jgi:hypothetical protein
MLQGCFKGSARMLKAPGMFQEGLKDASRMVQRYYMDAPRFLRRSARVLK